MHENEILGHFYDFLFTFSSIFFCNLCMLVSSLFVLEAFALYQLLFIEVIHSCYLDNLAVVS